MCCRPGARGSRAIPRPMNVFGAFRIPDCGLPAFAGASLALRARPQRRAEKLKCCESPAFPLASAPIRGRGTDRGRASASAAPRRRTRISMAKEELLEFPGVVTELL